MGKIARAVTALLSVFMVFAPLSASACDLSCWLNQTISDCHSAGPFTEGSPSLMSAPAMMDMSAEGEMSSHGAQDNEDYNVSGAAHHSSMTEQTDLAMTEQMDLAMTEQMDLARRPVEVTRTDVSSTSGFSPSKKLSRCSHETCSQASASASPQRVRGDQPAYLLTVDIAVRNPANFLTNPHEAVFGTPPPITPAADLLIALRI